MRATNFEKISRSQKKKRTEVEQSLFPSFHPSATFLLHRIRRTQNCPLLSHTPSLCLLDAMMTYYHASSSSSRAPFGGYIGFTSRIRSVVVTKKTHHTCVFKKKTSFSFLKSRLKKADILGYFHLFPAVTIPNYCLLSSQLIHITHTHIKRSHRRSICTRKAQLTVKSERLIFSRACEGERRARILYLIWHLFTRLSGSRVVAHSKKNHNALARWRERRS